MHVLQIVGARPQFVKLAPVSAAFRTAGHVETILHTGQHFDDAMSRVFFDELGIATPDVNLDIHSLRHGAMTGRMLERIEDELMARRPDGVLVYGDTDSTLAGALAAVKLGIPCAHVEAGLRSFNRGMPEELNRIAADALCDLLLVPSAEGLANLEREGLAERAVNVGDVMVDAVYANLQRARESGLAARLGLPKEGYVLSTLHRAATTDDRGRLADVLAALDAMAGQGVPVVLPLHPRTRAAAARFGLGFGRVRVLDPLPYVSMLALLADCAAVATDSGGLQKEAYLAGRPCLTLRDETEWVETVEAGANVVCGTTRERILEAFAGLEAQRTRARFGQPLYGDGHAARRIVVSVQGLLPKGGVL